MTSTLTTKERGRLLRFAAYASVATAFTLIALKIVAWMATGSVSLLASLIDSLMDSMASLINLIALHYSLQPPDAEHRFGHGKAEPLAGLAQACFIGGSALFLALQAFERFRRPVVIDDVTIGVVVMVLSTVITMGLLLVQRHVIHRTQSTAIRADALHYATDLLTNLSVLAALALAAAGWTWADPLFALLVAGYIFYSAVRIALEALQQLMDRELPGEVQVGIVQLALQHDGVRGVHDLRTRQSGQFTFVQMHLELDGGLPLARAHAIGEEVAAAIGQTLPGASVIIHHDPVAAVGPVRAREVGEPSPAR